MKQSRFQEFVDWLLDNVFDIATILVAGYLVFYYQRNSPTLSDVPVIVNWILAVLSLLAISGIWQRNRQLHRIEMLNSRAVSLLENQMADRPSAIAFFEKPPTLDTFIQTSNQIDLCGFTLTTVVNKQLSNLRERLKDGATIRLLISEPDSLALQMASLRSEDPDEGKYFSKRLAATIQDIEYLHKSWNEHQSTAKAKKGQLEVRFLPYAPSFSVLVFNGNQPQGKIIVEIYAHKTFAQTALFTLNSQKDGNWFSYFRNQFEVMWKDAKKWEPNS